MSIFSPNHSADDIRHGLPLESDLPIAERPDVPDMRDGVNIWFFEENGEFAVPRLAVDAVGDSWDMPGIGSNVAFPNERVLDGNGAAPAISAIDSEGRPTIRGNTALQFRCLEPFRKWHLSYDDEIVDTNIDAQLAGTIDRSRKTRFRIEADFALQIPVWSQLFADDDESAIAGWMGRGWRYETPVRIEGTMEIDGRERAFRGTGNLVRRKSRRSTYESFPGHCWEAAIFPDGRAFGINAYPAKEGEAQYNTGFIYKDGKYYDAKVVDTPWLTELLPAGDDCSLTIESELGLTRIRGESLLNTFKPGYQSMGGLSLHQGSVRYTWDDQTAIGMIERSSYTAALAKVPAE